MPQLFDFPIPQVDYLVLCGQYLGNLPLCLSARERNWKESNYFGTQILLFRSLCKSPPDNGAMEQIPIIEKFVVNTLEMRKSHARLADCTPFSNNRSRASDPFGFQSVYCDDNRSRPIQLKMAFSCGQRGYFFLRVENILSLQFSACHPRYGALIAEWIITPRRAPRGQAANITYFGLVPCGWGNSKESSLKPFWHTPVQVLRDDFWRSGLHIYGRWNFASGTEEFANLFSPPTGVV